MGSFSAWEVLKLIADLLKVLAKPNGYDIEAHGFAPTRSTATGRIRIGQRVYTIILSELTPADDGSLDTGDWEEL